MRLDAQSVRAGYAAGRRSILVEAEALRAEMQAHVEVLRADMAALHRALADARDEARLLREWRDAHVAHKQARRELLALYRQRMLERAWAAERDPALPLQ